MSTAAGWTPTCWSRSARRPPPSHGRSSAARRRSSSPWPTCSSRRATTRGRSARSASAPPEPEDEDAHRRKRGRRPARRVRRSRDHHDDAPLPRLRRRARDRRAHGLPRRGHGPALPGLWRRGRARRRVRRPGRHRVAGHLPGRAHRVTVVEQTRARDPDSAGYVERDGVRVFYETYGDREHAILLLPTWEVVHSRAWKCQIPYLARHSRVVTFDRRGNGRTDRPLDVRAYDRRATADDAIAVLDAAEVQRAVVVSWCGAGDDLLVAVEHPERVGGLVLIAPDLLLTDDPAAEAGPFPFEEEPLHSDGWAKWNRRFWLRDWPGFLDFFFRETFTEPHSTK